MIEKVVYRTEIWWRPGWGTERTMKQEHWREAIHIFFVKNINPYKTRNGNEKEGRVQRQEWKDVGRNKRDNEGRHEKQQENTKDFYNVNNGSQAVIKRTYTVFTHTRKMAENITGALGASWGQACVWRYDGKLCLLYWVYDKVLLKCFKKQQNSSQLSPTSQPPHGTTPVLCVYHTPQALQPVRS